MTFTITTEVLELQADHHHHMTKQCIADLTTAENMGTPLDLPAHLVSNITSFLSVAFADTDMFEDCIGDLPAGTFILVTDEDAILMTPEHIKEFELILSGYAHGLYLPGTDVLVEQK